MTGGFGQSPEDNLIKMVILNLIDDLGFGGAESLLMSYIPHLTNYSTIVVTFGITNEYPREGYTYIPLNLSPKRNPILIVTKLNEIIAAENVDIVHTHSYFAHILSRFLNRKIKLFNHYHFADYASLAHKRGVRFRLLLDRLTMKKSITIIGVSDYVSVTLKKIFQHNRVITISNFYDCKDLAIKKKMNFDKSLRIICIGNCNVEKNYPLLIDAFELLKERQVFADVFGGGPLLEALKKEAKLRGITKLSFKGSSNRIQEEIKKYDLFLSTSISESFGIVVLEAMCAGLPIVLSSIPSYIEIGVPDAVYFDDAKELSLILIEKANNMVEPNKKAYARKLEQYSLEQFLSRLKMLYNG